MATVSPFFCLSFNFLVWLMNCVLPRGEIINSWAKIINQLNSSLTDDNYTVHWLVIIFNTEKAVCVCVCVLLGLAYLPSGFQAFLVTLVFCSLNLDKWTLAVTLLLHFRSNYIQHEQLEHLLLFMASRSLWGEMGVESMKESNIHK